MLFLLFAAATLSAQQVRIASFNTERLGEDHKSYAALAKVVSDFDLTAAEEVMNRKGFNALLDRLGPGWSGFMSPVGEGSRRYREHFAFFYDASLEIASDLGEYPHTREFIRPPYGLRFRVKATGFEFNLIACHIIYGKRESARLAEINRLGRVYDYFESRTGERGDTIIAGDFNEDRPADFASLLGMGERDVLPAKGTTIGTHGPDHDYDHIFVSLSLRARVLSAGVYYWTRDFAWSRRNVSDHFPVFVVLHSAP